MKLIVSSDTEKIVNADRITIFDVRESDILDDSCYLCADGIALSMHKSRGSALNELRKLMTALSADNLPLLYQMEDTD